MFRKYLNIQLNIFGRVSTGHTEPVNKYNKWLNLVE